MAGPAPVPVSLAVSPRTAHKTRSGVQYASVAAATPLEPQHGPKASGRVKTRSHIAGGLPVVSLLVVCAVQVRMRDVRACRAPGCIRGTRTPPH